MDTQSTLNQLLRHTDHPGQSKKVAYENMATRLSWLRVLPNNNKTIKKWTWRYIQSVYRGTIQPSPALVQAIETLAAELDGTPAQYSNAKEIKLFADPARIQAGSLILGTSKECAKATCILTFVPTVPWGLYCPKHKRKR